MTYQEFFQDMETKATACATEAISCRDKSCPVEKECVKWWDMAVCVAYLERKPTVNAKTERRLKAMFAKIRADKMTDMPLPRICLDHQIAELKKARKQHECRVCHQSINKGAYYYSVVVAGGGLGSLKFPDRYHVGCLVEAWQPQLVTKGGDAAEVSD